MYAGIVEPAFGAGQAVAVIAPEKDDGVVGQAVLFQLAQNFSGLRVEAGNVVVVFGQLAADVRRIRVVGGQCERSGVCRRLLAWLDPALTLMGDPEIEYGKERLALLPKRAAPVRAPLVLVPDGDGVADLVVGLDVVRREIPGGPKIFREGLYVRRRRGVIRRGKARRIVRGAHMMPSPTVLMHACDDGRPARRAHAGGRKRLQIPGPLGGEAVQVGRVRCGVAVGAEPQADVFGGNPDDIGPLLRQDGRGGERNEQRRKAKTQDGKRYFHENVRVGEKRAIRAQ